MQAAKTVFYAQDQRGTSSVLISTVPIINKINEAFVAANDLKNTGITTYLL